MQQVAQRTEQALHLKQYSLSHQQEVDTQARGETTHGALTLHIDSHNVTVTWTVDCNRSQTS